MKVSFVYISLSGNTESFVRRLSDYLLEAHPGLEIEKIQETDNINDVIHAINKDYRLGLLLAKEITEKLK